MVRIVVAATLGIAALMPAALAQSSGNALCDDYLKKLEACLPKIPEAQRGVYKEKLDAYKKAFTDIPEIRKLHEGLCIQEGPLWKKSLPMFYGCAF